MHSIEKSVDVEVPVSTAYNQWTQFEQFPTFMEGVKEVRQLDAQRLSWKANVAGKDVEWTAEIVEQVPDQRIAWRSLDGAQNSGVVTFATVGASRARITLRLEYRPSGIAESSGSALGLVSARVQGDLERFKTFIEERGTETGQWRGQIP